MKYNFIDLIADYYLNNNKFDVVKRTQEENDFYDKYIEPEFEVNAQKGNEMEGGYMAAITSWQNLAFKYGFKAGIAIMTELLD